MSMFILSGDGLRDGAPWYAWADAYPLDRRRVPPCDAKPELPIGGTDEELWGASNAGQLT